VQFEGNDSYQGTPLGVLQLPQAKPASATAHGHCEPAAAEADQRFSGFGGIAEAKP